MCSPFYAIVAHGFCVIKPKVLIFVKKMNFLLANDFVYIYHMRCVAGLAQLVEHLICNQRVGGSSPSTGTTK